MNLDYSTLHFHSVIDNFSNQFRNEEFLDCTLNAEGKSIKVHKAVLCAQSSLLEKMILEHIHITDLYFTVDGVLFEDLKSVVQFMYDGCAKLTNENFGSFLVVAQLLGMKWVDYIQIQMNDYIPTTVKTIQEAELINMNLKSNEPKIPSLALKNITNLQTRVKRKRCCKGKKYAKKVKSRRNQEKKIVSNADLSSNLDSECDDSLRETDLTKMDVITFCSALGLKKNVGTVREPFSKVKMDIRKSVPSVIKINNDTKSNKENVVLPSVYENSIFIEEKNLSFLSAGTNEMCIRENNIEIECDVLEASNQFVVYEKQQVVGDIVELQEGNVVEAAFFEPEYVPNGSDKENRKSVSNVGQKSISSRKRVDKSYEGPAVFWCDVCQRTYHTKTGLNQHKRYECCKDPAFACPRCEKRFKRKSSLVRHAITLHDETIYPTRTKLLSKLTTVAKRNILTICGKRS